MTRISIELHDELGRDVAELSDSEQEGLERALIMATKSYMTGKAESLEAEKERERLRDKMRL